MFKLEVLGKIGKDKDGNPIFVGPLSPTMAATDMIKFLELKPGNIDMLLRLHRPGAYELPNEREAALDILVVGLGFLEKPDLLFVIVDMGTGYVPVAFKDLTKEEILMSEVPKKYFTPESILDQEEIEQIFDEVVKNFKKYGIKYNETHENALLASKDLNSIQSMDKN